MNPFRIPGRTWRPAVVVAALTWLALLFVTASIVWTAEGQKPAGRDGAAAKDRPRPPKPEAREAAPDDDFGPAKPPRDKDRRGQPKPKPPQFDDEQGDRDVRRPGPRRDPDAPPPGDDRRQGRPNPPRFDGEPGGPDARRPGPPGPPLGPDGPPRRPGPPGPGQPPGPPRGPRPDWGAMERNDPEMHKLWKAEGDLDRRTHELSAQYRKASKDERDKLKQELQKAVTQQFEARQQRRALELKRLEEELKRFRDGMERREKTQKQIIDKRVAELLGEENEPGF